MFLVRHWSSYDLYPWAYNNFHDATIKISETDAKFIEPGFWGRLTSDGVNGRSIKFDTPPPSNWVYGAAAGAGALAGGALGWCSEGGGAASGLVNLMNRNGGL